MSRHLGGPQDPQEEHPRNQTLVVPVVGSIWQAPDMHSSYEHASVVGVM